MTGLEGIVVGRHRTSFEKGWVCDPKGQAKSVILTEEGEQRCKELFAKLFGLPEEAPASKPPKKGKKKR